MNAQTEVIPVECEVVGTLPDGYHRGSLTVSPNTIQVSGAKKRLLIKLKRHI